LTPDDALPTALAADQARAAALDAGRGELPPPVFHDGQRVRVLLNDRNRTPHRGVIIAKVWHYKDRCWSGGVGAVDQ
jgi:hypothetical protein